MQTVGGVEEAIERDQTRDVDRFAYFMRAMNPPPILAQNSFAQNGRKLSSTCQLRTDLAAEAKSEIVFPTTTGD